MITTVTLILAAATALTQNQVNGHIALEEPPARNVMWRMGFNELAPHPNDDYLFCAESGGADCPPCGDNIDTPPPYPHQAGGYFAPGIIARTYTPGETIDVFVNVTRSHGGYVEFKLCPNNDMHKAVTQRCLDRYPLQIVGQRKNKVFLKAPYNAKEAMPLKVQLPHDLTCDQCVLQMTNKAEQFKPTNVMFRNCADIAIVPGSSSSASHRRPHHPRFHG